MQESIWIRDTLIRKEIFDTLPVIRQHKIDDLIKEYQGSNYTDARYHIGPSQNARMSNCQREQISNTALRVFRIEEDVKLLMRSDEQIKADEKAEQVKKVELQIRSVESSIKNLEEYCSKKLSSNRDNNTKKAYRMEQDRLKDLRKQLEQLQASE